MNDLATNAIDKINLMKLEKLELANEVLRLRNSAKSDNKLLHDKYKEIELLSAKTKPDFEVETIVTSDRRIRFSPPEEIKKKLKAGQKVRLEVRLLVAN